MLLIGIIVLHARDRPRLSAAPIIGAERHKLTRIDALLADYGSYHRTRGNLVCHAFGITLIVYGLLALLQLAALPGGRWTLAEVFVAAASLYYLTLSVPLGLTMLAEAVALDLIARYVADWRVGLAAFVAGWIFQGIGHARYEKKSPAFVN